MNKALTGFPAVNSVAIWLTSCGILWGRLGGEALYDKIPLWWVSHGCIYHPSNLGDSLPRRKVLRSNESGKEYAIPACWRLWEVLQLKNRLNIYQTDLIIRPLKKIKTLILETLKEMATHSSILAGEIPWTEKPGGIQSMGPSMCPQRIGHNWVTNTLIWSKTKISTISVKGQTV